jgi:SAM-dependent methyltransferase
MMPDHIGQTTERAGEPVTAEQILRNYSRYAWARQYCRDKRVLEIACGTGQGLGMLIDVAQSVIATDIDSVHIDQVRRRYGARARTILAQPSALPLAPASVDVVVIFEALYFFADLDAVIAEVLRVMARPGSLLLSLPNKDMIDFSPSPYATRYFAGPDLRAYLQTFGFDVSLFGDYPTSNRGIGDKTRTVLKWAANSIGIFPHSLWAKNVLKRVFFGPLQGMPDIFAYGSYDVPPPTPIANDADRRHKVLLAHASLG